MPDFSFNFNAEDESLNVNDAHLNDGEGSLKDEIKWKPAKEQFLKDSHLEKLSVLLSVEHLKVCNVTINFVNSETVVQKLEADNYDGDMKTALENQSDLVPGVYEGGLKIWECSEDLVNYLGDQQLDDLSVLPSLKGLKVLELGCGAGLPGVYCFIQGASVWFNDYNEDVLNEVTIPNTLLNVPNDTMEVSRFFSGDWESLETGFLDKEVIKEEDKFDLILTSETIYNISNQKKLISIFKKFVKKSGQILVAAKTFYFGVGGGLIQFTKLVESEGLQVEIVRRFEEGVRREILKITL